MKIPLRVVRKFGQWMPFVLVTIKAPRVRLLPFEALVDTGSPWIAITPRDILRLNISIKHLKKVTEYAIVSLASHKFQRYQLQGAGVCIKDEEGKITSVKLPISILWPTKKKWPDEIKDIPSVLGSDFLTVGEFCLFFDPSKQIAFLER